MKMLGAKAFWVVKKEPDQRMKFRRTNKVGKFEVTKVKKKGAVSKNVVVSRSLHAPQKQNEECELFRRVQRFWQQKV